MYKNKAFSASSEQATLYHMIRFRLCVQLNQIQQTCRPTCTCILTSISCLFKEKNHNSNWAHDSMPFLMTTRVVLFIISLTIHDCTYFFLLSLHLLCRCLRALIQKNICTVSWIGWETRQMSWNQTVGKKS